MRSVGRSLVLDRRSTLWLRLLASADLLLPEARRLLLLLLLMWLLLWTFACLLSAEFGDVFSLHWAGLTAAVLVSA